MNDADKKAFESKFGKNDGNFALGWALQGWQAALAHRDAQRREPVTLQADLDTIRTAIIDGVGLAIKHVPVTELFHSGEDPTPEQVQQELNENCGHESCDCRTYCQRAQGQQEPVMCLVGMKGSAFDTPQTKRAYTYKEQPGSTAAWRLGNAQTRASRNSGGDNIDYGLNLLKQLEVEGFGVFEIGAEYTTPPAAPDVRQVLDRLAGEIVCLEWAVAAQDPWSQIELRVKDIRKIVDATLAKHGGAA